MTVAAVDSSPHVTIDGGDDVVLLRRLPHRLRREPGPVCPAS